jgi:glycosyltransferase involved in cell wall biosynthesis
MTDSLLQRGQALPQVSIIINCFNSEQYLRETLESVIGQSFLDWELIFWDNRSQDRSAQIFLGYQDHRFKYFLAEEFTSLGDARNLAVAKANGKWLAFLDCDDVWPANKLALQIAAIDEASIDNLGFVYGLFDIKLEDTANSDKNSTSSYYANISSTPHGPVDLFPRLLVENFIIFSSVLILSSLYRDVGGINPRLRQNEDYDLLLKASQSSWAICIDSICVIYRVHPRSNSHSQIELSYYEFDLIYNSLPDSPIKYAAIRRNKSRFAAYKISRGELFDAAVMLIREGSIIWFIQRLFFRFSSIALSHVVKSK